MDGILAPNSDTATDVDIPLLSEVLNDNGFSTLLVGKWHMGYSTVDHEPYNRGFDEALFYHTGFHEYYNKQRCAPWVRFDAAAGAALNTTIRDIRNSVIHPAILCGYDLMDENGEFVIDETTYNEVMYTEKIIDFIGRNQDDPFFIFYSMATPHFPLVDPPAEDTIDPSPDYSLCGGETDPNRQNFCKMVW